MDICCNDVFFMPSSYVVMDENEMTYVEGGETVKKYDTAEALRNSMTQIIGASAAGIGDAAAIGAMIGGGLGAFIGAVVGTVYFQSYVTCAAPAHAQAEKIINKYGASTRCVLTTTLSFAGYCTSMTIEKV